MLIRACQKPYTLICSDFNLHKVQRIGAPHLLLSICCLTWLYPAGEVKLCINQHASQLTRVQYLTSFFLLNLFNGLLLMHVDIRLGISDHKLFQFNSHMLHSTSCVTITPSCAFNNCDNASILGFLKLDFNTFRVNTTTGSRTKIVVAFQLHTCIRKYVPQKQRFFAKAPRLHVTPFI